MRGSARVFGASVNVVIASVIINRHARIRAHTSASARSVNAPLYNARATRRCWGTQVGKHCLNL